MLRDVNKSRWDAIRCVGDDLCLCTVAKRVVPKRLEDLPSVRAAQPADIASNTHARGPGRCSGRFAHSDYRSINLRASDKQRSIGNSPTPTPDAE